MVGLGEAVYGAGKGKSIVAYVTLSTGIGGAKIVDGKVEKTYFGFEPGMMLMPDREGKNEYFEKLISGKSLEEKYGKTPFEIDDPAVWEYVVQTLAIGLNNIAVLWSPEVIVLGGSVPQKLDFQKVSEEFGKYLKIFPEAPELKLATIDEKGGLWGCLAVLRNLP